MTLRPRVYKRFKDNIVDAGSKMVLVTFLVVSLYYDEQSDARNGGQAAHADIMYCSNFLAESSCETTTGLCDWDATDLQCAARPAAADAADAGVLQHLLYSLPGLAPLLLNWVFKPRNRKPKAETTTSEGETGRDPGLEGTGDWTVVRVGYSHNPPPPHGHGTRGAAASIEEASEQEWVEPNAGDETTPNPMMARQLTPGSFEVEFESAGRPATAAPAPAATSATAEWTEHWSEEHECKYWQHAVTGESVWRQPEAVLRLEPQPEVQAGPLPETREEWIKKWSGEYRRPYWVGVTTGKSTWSDPRGGASSPQQGDAVAVHRHCLPFIRDSHSDLVVIVVIFCRSDIVAPG
jgi:hypothetical protein